MRSPINLSAISGLPIAMGQNLELVFPHSMMVRNVSERSLDEMRPFLQSASVTATKNIIYRVWHQAAMMADQAKIKATGLRYDLTAIEAGTFKLGNDENEFFKTAGHYHPDINGVNYPEVYEVLAGLGQWIIQRFSGSPEIVDQAYLIEASPGEKILIPPGFGHVTINSCNETLVIANVIGASVGHEYTAFEKLHGACYRLLASTRFDMVEIERNTRYLQIPDLAKLKPKKDWLKGYFDPLYSLLAKTPESLTFLAEPESYNPEFFSMKKLYQEITVS